MKNIILLTLVIFIIGCNGQPKKEVNESLEKKEIVKKKRPVALENGKFFEVNSKISFCHGCRT